MAVEERSSIASMPELGGELKFFVPPIALPFVLSRLQALFLPDAAYPSAIVSSVYFDTREWHALEEKRSSDYRKMKVRVRWYRVGANVANDAPAFLEAKMKIGTRRFKPRVRLPGAASWLETVRLDDEGLSRLPRRLREVGVTAPPAASPVLVLSYRRRRFVDPLSEARLALDSDLSVPRVNPLRLPVHRQRQVAGAVLEVKGRSPDLPRLLDPILALGCRRTVFCKYQLALDRLVRGGR